MSKVYYCTKHALTRGVVKFSGEVVGDGRYVSGERRGIDWIFATLGKEVFESQHEAAANALRRAEKNVDSKRQALSEAEATLESFRKGEIPVVGNGFPVD